MVKAGQKLDPAAAESLNGTRVENNQSELQALSELPAEILNLSKRTPKLDLGELQYQTA